MSLQCSVRGINSFLCLFVMHTAINQLIPPNCVNYSRKFNFLTGNIKKTSVVGLLLVKTNIVEVYTIENENVKEKKRLKLLSKHTFATRIESIEVISRPNTYTSSSSKQQSDLIFLSFSDCKVSPPCFLLTLNHFIVLDVRF